MLEIKINGGTQENEHEHERDEDYLPNKLGKKCVLVKQLFSGSSYFPTKEIAQESKRSNSRIGILKISLPHKSWEETLSRGTKASHSQRNVSSSQMIPRSGTWNLKLISPVQDASDKAKQQPSSQKLFSKRKSLGTKKSQLS